MHTRKVIERALGFWLVVPPGIYANATREMHAAWGAAKAVKTSTVCIDDVDRALDYAWTNGNVAYYALAGHAPNGE